MNPRTKVKLSTGQKNMKKINKIIIVFLGLIVAFSATSVLASGPFNGQSGDCPSMGIGVYPNNIQRDSYGCWTATSVTADAGDTVNVEMWYHNNTSNTTLTGVKAKITKSGSGMHYTFSGDMYSNQGNTNLGSVSLDLTSSQTLTYSSAHWMKDKQAIDSDTDTAIINMNNGVQASLGNGNVPPGWDDYGAIVIVYKVGTNNTNNDNCIITDFTANGSSSTTIQSGDLVNLDWNTNGCDSVHISNISGILATSGSRNVYPNYDITYTLTAYDSNSVAQTRSVYVNVDDYNNNTCDITEFTVDGSSSSTYINDGDSVDLVWDTNGCDHVSVTGLGFNSTAKTGDRTIVPDYAGDIRITAYSYSGGTQNEYVHIYFDNNNYNYNNCTISNFTASSTSVNSGQPVTLTWNTYNCNYVNVSGIGSNLPVSYSRVIYPTTTNTYTLTAYGRNQNPSRSLSIYVNNYVPPVVSACAVTSIATNVGRNSVTLNGFVNNTNYGNANTYFTYGTTVGMYSSTTVRSSGSGAFSETLTGLSPNTIYYFRLVSNCNGGSSMGDVEIFETTGDTTNTRTVVYQGTTVVGTSSPIMLKIENRYQSIRVGDSIEYTVTYKNIGSKKLTNSILQVVLPRGISFEKSSRGTYSSDSRTLTVELGDLDPKEEGVVYLQGNVDSIRTGSAQIVTNALLVYTSAKGAQENAMAYVLNDPNGNGSSLGALAFFSGLFGMSLIGWLLLIIIILLIILIVRKYYYGIGNDSSVDHH